MSEYTTVRAAGLMQYICRWKNGTPDEIVGYAIDHLSEYCRKNEIVVVPLDDVVLLLDEIRKKM